MAASDRTKQLLADRLVELSKTMPVADIRVKDLCATCGVVLPSFLIILAVARGYEKFRRNRLVAGVLTGLRPAVIGLIAAALFSLAQSVFFPAGPALSPAFFVSAAIFLAAAVLAFRRVHPITLIVLSAVCGVAAGTALGL